MKVLTEIKRLFLHFKHQGLMMGLLAGYDKLYRWITGGPSERFSKITNRIWIGGQPRSEGIEKLVAHGITAIVNMREEYDYEKKIQMGALKYLQLPIEDNGAPSFEHLCHGADFVRNELHNKGTVYIHCWEGLGRSATLAAAYFILEGNTLDQALKIIRRRRPFIRLNGVQLERLEEFSVSDYCAGK